jgi:hypothetical protein
MGAPVVVNQYSIPKTTRGGGVKGTRGSTPSAFVLDYMARPDAAEDVGGRIVTDSAICLSDDQAADLGRRFDESFASGGVLLKTVVSLDHRFLLDHELVPADTKPAARKGDYAGKIDQVRLREAVSHALRHLGRRGGFGDLLAGATIQTDTKHVHIHMALMDLNPLAGRRNTRRAEQQATGREVKNRAIPPARGTIRASERDALRQGLSHHLTASKARSLARTPAITRLLTTGAGLSRLAKRLIGKRKDKDKQPAKKTPAPPRPAPKLTRQQAHHMLTLRRAADRRLCRALALNGHQPTRPMASADLTDKQDRDLREVLEDIYTNQDMPAAGKPKVDPRVWDLIASDPETASLARDRGFAEEIDQAVPETGEERSNAITIEQAPAKQAQLGGPAK